MTESTPAPATVEIKLTREQAETLLPVYAWLTRAETPKGGSARGTASFWAFVGGNRPSIATLVSLHKADKLHGDALIGEDLIPLPDGADFPAAHIYTQGTGKNVTRWTTRRYDGMRDLSLTDETHPLAAPAGASVSDLTKWITAVIPDAMEQIKIRREEARKAAERKAAGDLMDKTVKDLEAAIEVARTHGLDVTAQEAMLATFKAQQAAQQADIKPNAK
ncbi:hypothetical protein AB0K21_21885 [Streptosporangium sp. NPDC049248]|uniref:hypothetical protein n=1 Tax=Streptosporangium sp. NPDC049248 TaxID=3155651 RepID=UPI0034287978